MNPIKNKRKNNFLVETNEKYANLSRKEKILIKKIKLAKYTN
jgi:hypothetical protein